MHRLATESPGQELGPKRAQGIERDVELVARVARDERLVLSVDRAAELKRLGIDLCHEPDSLKTAPLNGDEAVLSQHVELGFVVEDVA